MVSQEFVLAGDAIFTVSNGKGDHYTFRVTRKASRGAANVRRYGEWCWFVSVLKGPDNGSDYLYLGIVDAKRGSLRLTGKAGLPAESVPVKVLIWALRHIWAGSRDSDLPAGYSIQNAGKCGRCGRLLTTPDSLECGIGPECRKLTGGGAGGGRVVVPATAGGAK